jgi:hypothetical protein
VKISTGPLLRVNRIGVGSVSVHCLESNGNDGWRKGDTYQIAPGAVVEVA